MRTLESLDTLQSKILDLDARKVDLIADTRRMHAADNLDLVVDTDEGIRTFSLSDHARGQVSTDLGIPKRYFDRMSSEAPELLRDNVNHWLASEPNRRMLRGYDEGLPSFTGRAWLSDRYRRIDHIEIARRLLPEFENVGTQVEFHNAAITDTKLYLRAVFPQMQAEVKVGDEVRWGVELRNSEIGSGMFSISGFVLRLICINGMVVTEEIKQRHVGRRIEEEGILSDEALRADDTAFWLAARDVLRATITETRFEEVVSQLRESTTGQKIERVIQASEVLQQRLSLSDEEREAVLTHLVSGGDLSRWGALNAVTASAQAVESFDRQAELEGLGWQLATMEPREWEAVALARA